LLAWIRLVIDAFRTKLSAFPVMPNTNWIFSRTASVHVIIRVITSDKVEYVVDTNRTFVSKVSISIWTNRNTNTITWGASIIWNLSTVSRIFALEASSTKITQICTVAKRLFLSASIIYLSISDLAHDASLWTAIFWYVTDGSLGRTSRILNLTFLVVDANLAEFTRFAKWGVNNRSRFIYSTNLAFICTSFIL
jgi:hypothetical protein